MDFEREFNASKQIWVENGLLFQEIAKEYGIEKALELHKRSYDVIGQGAAAMIKDEFGEDVDHKAIGEMYIEGNRSWGLDCELQAEGASTVVLKNRLCPRYEGLKEAGLDDETIMRHCEVGVAALRPHFMSVGLDFGIRDWSAPEGHCDEVISTLEWQNLFS